MQIRRQRRATHARPLRSDCGSGSLSAGTQAIREGLTRRDLAGKGGLYDQRQHVISERHEESRGEDIASTASRMWTHGVRDRRASRQVPAVVHARHTTSCMAPATGGRALRTAASATAVGVGHYIELGAAGSHHSAVGVGAGRRVRPEV